MFETIRSHAPASRIAALLLLLTGSVAVVGLSGSPPAAAPIVREPVPPAPRAARIEAVFVLDTTGSMSGLIEGAKQKIWTLASEMAQAQGGAELRLGLIAYRDRGDAYVTRAFDLSPDVDALYAQLQALSAAGGGDGPESVNQALHEAVTGMSWSAGEGPVYRTIFLVGDAPPHMDYAQDVPYTRSLARARERGIAVNTIQCGADPGTRRVWQEIASLAQGEFHAIAQDGAMVAIATPVDEALGRLNAELSATGIVYGAEPRRRELRDKLARAAEAAPAPAAARLSYLSKTGGKLNSGRMDLVDAVRSGVSLEEIPEAELPATLQALDADARRALVESKVAERERIQEKIGALVEKRDAWLAEERARRKAEGDDASFDDRVIDAVKAQAAEKGIVY